MTPSRDVRVTAKLREEVDIDRLAWAFIQLAFVLAKEERIRTQSSDAGGTSND